MALYENFLSLLGGLGRVSTATRAIEPLIAPGQDVMESVQDPARRAELKDAVERFNREHIESIDVRGVPDVILDKIVRWNIGAIVDKLCELVMGRGAARSDLDDLDDRLEEIEQCRAIGWRARRRLCERALENLPQTDEGLRQFVANRDEAIEEIKESLDRSQQEGYGMGLFSMVLLGLIAKCIVEWLYHRLNLDEKIKG